MPRIRLISLLVRLIQLNLCTSFLHTRTTHQHPIENKQPSRNEILSTARIPSQFHVLHSSSTKTTATTNNNLRNDDDDISSRVSNRDKEMILRQLGYVPSNLLEVSARRTTSTSTISTPLALKTYPLNGGGNRRKNRAKGKLTPFPTLYWFCCPVVGKAIAELERRGFVGVLEKRLLDDYRHSLNSVDDDGGVGGRSALEQFVASHEEYAKERWETLQLNHQMMLENELEGTNQGMRDMIRYSGIAGTDFKSFGLVLGGEEGSTRKDNNGKEVNVVKPSIKCLHAHYAHYRSQIQLLEERVNTDHDETVINIVGEWIHEALQEEFPDLSL